MEEQTLLPQVPSVRKSITDVFVTPSELFQNLKGTAQAPALWAIPLIVSAILIILTFVAFSVNDSLQAESREIQQRNLQKMADEGKITEEQLEQIEERTESMGAIRIVFGSIGGIVFLCIYYFAGALFLWLANKLILKSKIGYVKHLEMYGVCSWIGVLGNIVALLMMLAFGTMAATPSLSLILIGNYDPALKLHKFLSAINIFSIWQTIVVGIGLSKFSEKPASTGITVAFGLWIAWTLIISFVSPF